MSKKNRVLDIRRILFYFCYFCIFANYAFQGITFLSGSLLSVLYRSSLALLVFLSLINITKLSKRSVLIVFGAAALLTLGFILTKDTLLIIPFLFILAARDISLDDFIKHDLWIKIPSLIIVPILFFLGFTGVHNIIRGSTIRYSMGFYNPNVFSALVMSAVLEVLYLRREHISKKEIFFSILALFLVDYFADSRTQIICIIAMLVALVVTNYNKHKTAIKNKFVKILLYSSAFAMTIISLLITNNYINNPGSYMSKLDTFSSGRIKSSAIIVEQYGLSVLGNEQVAVELRDDRGVSTLDNTYIYLATVNGVALLALFCVLSAVYFKYANSNNEKILIIIMLIFILSGLMEKMCIRIQLNVFLLYFSYMLYGYPEYPKILKTGAKHEKK